jgi:hypothetical protein
VNVSVNNVGARNKSQTKYKIPCLANNLLYSANLLEIEKVAILQTKIRPLLSSLMQRVPLLC